MAPGTWEITVPNLPEGVCVTTSITQTVVLEPCGTKHVEIPLCLCTPPRRAVRATAR